MKPGYKLSELGVIPEEWEVKRFAELFAFRNGVNADMAAYGQGVRFINVLEPITYSHIHGPEITGKVTLPEAIVASYAVRRGDVLFNRTSETQEEVALAATYLGSECVVFGGFVIRGRPLSENFDPVYAGYALRAPCIRSQIIPMGQGAVRANVGQQNLGRVFAALPPLPEQRAIAEVLSDVDGLLSGLERLIAKKRDLKQAAMQQLLTGQARLPGFVVKSGYKKTDAGIIPEDWKMKALAEIVDKIMVGIASAATHAYRTKGIPMFRNQNIKTGYLDDGDLLFITPEYEVMFKNKRLREGDLLTMRTGYPGVTAIVPLRYESAQSFTTLITRPRQHEAVSSYLCHYINSEMGQGFFTQSQIGGAQKNVNAGTLRHMPVPLPKVPEQIAIAEVLTEMDLELVGLEQRREKTRALKQAMMQELLTGRTRLV